ncbi:MAG: TonB-dependent receptor [Acidobacteria bacterium]|nr:TonB-dependent receptor [Acidobacteriota bacterium]
MKIGVALFSLGFTLLCVGRLPAQETRSTISGAVNDSSGAAIAGAKITVTEVRTGVRTLSSSDAAGHYTIPFLPPGDYQVYAEMSGFKSYVRSGIHLASGDQIIIDVRLEVGQVSQTVEVRGEAPLIDYANSSTGQTITTKQVEDFPLNGRNPIMITQLAIGVVATGNPTLVHPFDNGAGAAWSIGGLPSQTSELLMDGAPNATWDNRAAYAPPQDAVQEVKVKAFDTDAAYGHTASGTINEVMKTGTNRLHGSLYEFTQPSALSANTVFNSLANIPVQDTKYNQYGLTAGGPVMIPKLYDGRNKLFWFFTWEKLTDSQPNTKFLTVPTDAERTGDLSALLKLGASYQIFNPYSGTLSGNTVNRVPFKCDSSGNPVTPKLTSGAGFGTQVGGTPCNIIPQQLLNPVALAYLKFYPKPNLAGTATGYSNLGNSSTTDDDYSNELGRLDWATSDRSRLAFNIRHNTELQSKNNYFGNHTTGSLLTRENWGATFDEVYTFSPSLILNVRANYTRMREGHPAPLAGFDPSSLGFPSYLGSSSTYRQLPAISFGRSCGNDTTQASSFDCFSSSTSDLVPSQSYQVFGDLVKQLNNHALKVGVDARQYRLDAQSYGASTGAFSFTTQWTSGPTSSSPAANFGQDFAAFLLGLPTSGTFDLNTRGTYTSYYSAFFLQDDWRVKSNLTLNLGLRFDYETPYREKLGRTNNGFNFAATNPVAGSAIAAYNTKTASKMPFPVNFLVPGGLTFPSPSDGAIYDNKSRLASPRIGFAWSPGILHEKTVIRGGFGLFVQPIALSNLNPTGGYSTSPILTQQGFNQTTQVAVASNFLLPGANLTNPFPNGFLQPGGSSAGLATFDGQTVNFLNPRMTNPYAERWTVGVEHAIGQSTVVEVAYIGNHALDLPVAFVQFNGIPRQYLSTLPRRDTTLVNTLTASVPNPFAGLLPGTSLNGTNTMVQQVIAPFPEYPVTDSTTFSSGLVERNVSRGSSYFHELNVRVERRFSKGLQLVGIYGLSKLIERDAFLNATDVNPEKRISPFDHTHRFVAAANYELPIGRGRLVNVGSRWADVLIGGWAVNGIYTYQTGAPILWMNGSSNNPGDYPLCAVPAISGACPVGSEAVTLGPLHLNNRRISGVAFDTSHFVTASGGQFQFHLRSLPTTFSDLRQDGQNNFDASLLKRVSLNESTYLQFRLEAFNVWNHPTYGAPNTQVTSTSFGVINTQANRPRQLQFGVRFVF